MFINSLPFILHLPTFCCRSPEGIERECTNMKEVCSKRIKKDNGYWSSIATVNPPTFHNLILKEYKLYCEKYKSN